MVSFWLIPDQSEEVDGLSGLSSRLSATVGISEVIWKHFSLKPTL